MGNNSKVQYKLITVYTVILTEKFIFKNKFFIINNGFSLFNM